MSAPPEFWLRGQVTGVIPALQPVAHVLLQLAEDLPPRLIPLTHEQCWARPGDSPSIGFHLAHLSGSLDRLFTYARGESLSTAQRDALLAERGLEEVQPPAAILLARLQATLDAARHQLRDTPADALFDARKVGRAGLPSTVLGLLFHAAEHSARHAGQIVTLSRVVQAG